MKLIVGLGNPGNKYEHTRHNAGFMVIDSLVSKVSDVKWEVENKYNTHCVKYNSFIFIKPQTFMNDSGNAVRKIASFYKIFPPDIWVIHDDLDLKLGEYKIQKGVGPKVHYGINSVEDKLGSKDFWRVRIGVDDRDKENRINGEDYVLQEFTKDEENVLESTIAKVTEEIIQRISAS